jgi:hypothetical protein
MTTRTESIWNALGHHMTTGAIETFAHTPGRRKPWSVDIPGERELLTLTDREVHALCLGLAAGERAGRRSHDHDEPERPAEAEYSSAPGYREAP